MGRFIVAKAPGRGYEIVDTSTGKVARVISREYANQIATTMTRDPLDHEYAALFLDER